MTIEIVEFIQSFHNRFFDLFFEFVSFLGEQYVYIVVITFIYWLYDKKMGEMIALTFGISAVANNYLKEIIGAQRPFEKYGDRVRLLRAETATGNSFPSGHTMNFTAALFSLAFYKKKRNLFMAALLLGLLMGLSRMYLGVHFLEDVVFAIALGSLTAYLVHVLYQKFDNKMIELYKYYLVVLVTFLPVLFLLKDNDFFKSAGLVYGLVIGLYYEKKYVQFRLDISLKKKVIRYLVGIVILLSIQLGLGTLFDLINGGYQGIENALDFIKYFALAFIGFGLYPKLFTKYNF